MKMNENKNNMVSLISLFCITYLLLLAPMHHVEAVKEIKVGDDFGWQEPSKNNTSVYSQWAGRHRFHIGDSLLFEYKNDSVLQVEKWGYYHCNASKAIIAYNNEKSVMKLDRSGPFYFISGSPDHCNNGQRLLVEVMGQHQPQMSPTYSIAAPPQVYFGPTTTVSSAPAPESPQSLVYLLSLLFSVYYCYYY